MEGEALSRLLLGCPNMEGKHDIIQNHAKIQLTIILLCLFILFLRNYSVNYFILSQLVFGSEYLRFGA